MGKWLVKPPRPVLQRGHPLARGLILAVPMWERAGRVFPNNNASVYDQVYGLPGTFDTDGVTYPTWTVGQLGHAVDFDAAENDRIDFGSHARLQVQQHSFAMWIKLAAAAATGGLISRQNIVSDGWEWEVQGGVLAYAYFDGAVRGWYLGTGAVPVGSWALVAGVWRQAAGAVDFYIDGKLDASVATTTGTITHNAGRSMFLGSRQGGANWVGQVGAAWLWNRCLTATEVRGLFHDPWGMYRQRFMAQSDPFGLMSGLGLAPAAAVAQRLQRDNIIAEWWRRRAFR